MTAVQLETQRLLLRELISADADVIVDFSNDPEFDRYRLRSQRSEAVTRRSVHQAILASTLIPRMYYALAIVPKPSTTAAENSLVGVLTLSLDWNPVLLANIGFEIHPAHWGRGYATEAAFAALQMSFDELGVASVMADCFAANQASIRVMEKIGMQRSRSWIDSIALRVAYGEMRPVVRHQVRRDEWQQRLYRKDPE